MVWYVIEYTYVYVRVCACMKVYLQEEYCASSGIIQGLAISFLTNCLRFNREISSFIQRVGSLFSIVKSPGCLREYGEDEVRIKPGTSIIADSYSSSIVRYANQCRRLLQCTILFKKEITCGTHVACACGSLEPRVNVAVNNTVINWLYCTIIQSEGIA